jgi:hypothetical protein
LFVLVLVLVLVLKCFQKMARFCPLEEIPEAVTGRVRRCLGLDPETVPDHGAARTAKWAGQPRTPCTPMAVAIARSTSLALGSPERCSGDANSAPARAALMLRS